MMNHVTKRLEGHWKVKSDRKQAGKILKLLNPNRIDGTIERKEKELECGRSLFHVRQGDGFWNEEKGILPSGSGGGGSFTNRRNQSQGKCLLHPF
jgi:hypothetical protein